MSWAVSVFENGKLYQRIQYKDKRPQSVLCGKSCSNAFEGNSNGRATFERVIQRDY